MRSLMAMNEVGLLAAFLPEWAHIVCRWQHVMYHTYTVDVHSIFLVEELRRLWQGKYEQAVPELTELMRGCDDRAALFLGCLLHDIGKGFGGNHSEKGASRARRCVERLGLAPERVERVVFLVQHHLLMSHLAQSRDLSDPKLILEFARVARDRSQLRDLYLLTFADIRASSKKAWTDWKGQLLRDLFERTSEFLETGSDDPSTALELIDERVEVRRQAAAAELQSLGVAESKVRDYFESMPRRYFIAHTPRADRAARAGGDRLHEGARDVDGGARDAGRLVGVHPVHARRARAVRERGRGAHGARHQHPRRQRLLGALRRGARGLSAHHARRRRRRAAAAVGEVRADAGGRALGAAARRGAARAAAAPGGPRPAGLAQAGHGGGYRTTSRTSTRSSTSRRTTGWDCCTI